jgi:hypothetical protein
LGGLARRRTVILAAVGLVLALVLLYLNLANSFVACGETSGCARDGPPVRWLGRVFTDGGQPASNATVQYRFDSMESSGHDLGLVSVQTDAAGRYCLIWPRESQVASVSATMPMPSSGAPDPRVQNIAAGSSGPVIVTEPNPDTEADQDREAPGGLADRRLWSPATDSTTNCSRQSPPWYRVEGLESNWRLQLLFYLALAALGLSMASLSRRSRTVGDVLARVAITCALAGLVLWILIWETHTL